MSENPYNPDDPAFLFSRGLDEALSGAERRRLENALAASEELRTQANQLAAVDRLIKRWGAAKVELDWEHQATLVHAEATGETESADSGRVDALLARWGARQVELDWARFTEAVMAEVGTEARPGPRRRLLFRLAAPLAAAAVLVLSVHSGFWRVTSVPPTSVVMIGPATLIEGSSSSGEPRRVVVSYGRMVPDPDAATSTVPRISFVSVGSTPLAAWSDERAPL